jgi:hypothetical protein
MTITASLKKYNNVVANIPSATALQATVQSPRGITSNTVSLTTTQSNAPISIKNNSASLNQGYLHNLLDVVDDHPVDGSTLVYHADTGKYVVEPLTLSVNSLDGGTF